MKKRIIIIEDDNCLGEVLHDFFSTHGYSVEWKKDGASGLQLILQEQFDLCITDVLLPDTTGFMVIEKMREYDSQTPVIFMTGTEFSKEQHIKAYKLGANNYYQKPIIPEILLAQIEHLLSHHRILNFQHNGIQIRIDNQSVTIKNEQFELKEKEAKLLALLLENNNRTVARAEILQEIWKNDNYKLNSTLDSTVSNLRRKLTAFPEIQITTVYGCGMRID